MESLWRFYQMRLEAIERRRWFRQYMTCPTVTVPGQYVDIYWQE